MAEEDKSDEQVSVPQKDWKAPKHKPTKHDYECRCREYQYISIALALICVALIVAHVSLKNDYDQYRSYQDDARQLLINNVFNKADAQVDCERQCDSLKMQIAELQNKTCAPALPPCESDIIGTMEQTCANKTVIGVECKKFNEWSSHLGNATLMPCEMDVIGKLKKACGIQPAIQLDCQTIQRWKYGM